MGTFRLLTSAGSTRKKVPGAVKYKSDSCMWEVSENGFHVVTFVSGIIFAACQQASKTESE